MIPKKPFYFMRHGQTDWNLQDKLIGQTDIPLNEMGKKQAQSVVFPAQAQFKIIVYSPLLRVIQTMELATSALECTRIPMDAFKEWNVGQLVGQPGEALEPAPGVFIDPPGGETFNQLKERTIKGLEKALIFQQDILILSHEGIFQALCGCLGLSLAEPIDHCEIVLFNPVGDAWELQRF